MSPFIIPPLWTPGKKVSPVQRNSPLLLPSIPFLQPNRITVFFHPDDDDVLIYYSADKTKPHPPGASGGGGGGSSKNCFYTFDGRHCHPISHRSNVARLSRTTTTMTAMGLHNHPTIRPTVGPPNSLTQPDNPTTRVWPFLSFCWGINSLRFLFCRH